MTEKLNFQLSPEQLKTYQSYSGLALPRHTSYPIAALWTEKFDGSAYKKSLEKVGISGAPLSLYIHIPFCEQLCFYCACNKEILGKEKLKKGDPRIPFLEHLEEEMKQVSTFLRKNPITEIHFGGGTPTSLTIPQTESLMNMINKYFNISEDVDFSVEIDPRVTTEEHIELLVKHGMSRVSLGVQDFDHKVQTAINRVQPYEMVEKTMETCRKHGIKSINFDLIYGLPFQSMETMMTTLDQVFNLSPDRIAFYRLAVIPDMFKWQKSFSKIDLLKDEKLLEINMKSINRFQEEGYHFIGLDHFAKEEESLKQSEKEGSLRRNFQGMTTGGEVGIIGLGPSAISQLPNCFAQNPKKTEAWANSLSNTLPTERGISLNEEDLIVQNVISQLYCYGEIDKRLTEKEFDLESFDKFFSSEISRSKTLATEGLLELSADKVTLTPILGRLLVRAVASVFDRFLPENAYKEGINPNHASRLG